jgi:uncharacterized metal-binding protein YceD (DUF177 family)
VQAEPPIRHPLRTAEIAGRREQSFALEPDAAARRLLAAALGLVALDRLRFAGLLAPRGPRDLHLAGRLTARAVQACVVTLAPVACDIDVAVERIYVAGLAMPGPGETEMPADDRIEPMPATLDLGAVLQEALALALPDYPRAPGAVLGTAAFGPPGAPPLTEADLRPFARLGRRGPGGGAGGGGTDGTGG